MEVIGIINKYHYCGSIVGCLYYYMCTVRTVQLNTHSVYLKSMAVYFSPAFLYETETSIFNKEQYRQFTFKVTMRRVRVTIVVVEKQ